VPLEGNKIGLNFIGTPMVSPSVDQRIVAAGARLGVVAQCNADVSPYKQPIPSFTVKFTFAASEFPTTATSTFH
jgi:hypothetical protein